MSHQVRDIQWIREMLPITGFLRIPLRGYFLVLLALSIFGARGLEAIADRIQARGRDAALYLVTAALALHLAENVPFPLRVYQTHGLEEIPTAYAEFFRGRSGEVVVDLPSTLGITLHDLERDELDLWGYNRQTIYMLWQAQHRQNIVGGVHGFTPPMRKQIADRVEQLPAKPALTYLRSGGVRYLVFHRPLVFRGEEELEGKLDASPLLHKVLEGDELLIYEITAE